MTNEDPVTATDTEAQAADAIATTETHAIPQASLQHPLHQLLMEIAALPAIDAERVTAVLQKLQAGKLEILGDKAQQLASAQRIVKQIIDESSEIK